MKSKKSSSLVRSSVTLVIGDFLTKGSKFLMIPFYVKFLSKAQVGVLSLLQSAILLFGFFLGFEMSTAVKRFYFDYKEEKKADEFISFIWWGRLAASFLVAGIFVLILAVYNPFKADIPASYLQLAIIIGCLQSTFDLSLAKYLVKKQPLKVRTFSFAQFIVSTLFTIYLVAFTNMGILGYLYSQLAANAVFTVVSASIVTKKFRWSEYIARGKDLVKFAAPVVPHRIFNWGLALSDRFILVLYAVPLAEIGIYGIGYQLSNILSLVAASIQDAWLPYFFENEDAEDRRRKYSQTFKFYSVFITFLSFLFMLFSKEIVEVFSNKSYSKAIGIMNILVYANAISALYLALMNPIYYVKKTKFILVLSSTSFAFNVILNLIFIPYYGIWAAAVTTVVGNLVRYVLAYYMSQKLYPIPYDLKKIGIIGIFLTLSFFIATYLVSFKISVIIILIKFAVLTVISSLILFTNLIMDGEERTSLINMLKRKQKKKKYAVS